MKLFSWLISIIISNITPITLLLDEFELSLLDKVPLNTRRMRFSTLKYAQKKPAKLLAFFVHQSGFHGPTEETI